MSDVRIRFRTDGSYFDPDKPDDRPKPEPGDTWRIRWYKQGGDGPVAGYAICCPKCSEIHHWTTANNCKTGLKPCPHEGKSSCWEWTGSGEDGTLSANPSLHASGACGWHGWLNNGVLSGE